MGCTRTLLAMWLLPVLASPLGACLAESSNCPVAVSSPCLVSTFEIDSSGDGIVNSRYVYAYNEDGLLLTITGDGAGAEEDAPQVPDGTVDSLVTNFYDEQGVLTSSNHDAPLGFWRETYSYNELGQLITTEFDYERDDIVEVTYSYFYNEAGQLIRQENTNQSVETHEYKDGLLVATDKSFEGELQFRTQYNHTECGNRRLETTLLPDGSVRRYRVYAYSEEGILSEETGLTSQGVDADQTVHRNDEYGNRVRSEFDYDLDGSPDQIMSWTYSCPTPED